MLNEIMGSIHNFFEVAGGAYSQTWAIEGGIVSLPFLQDGQYFRIQGSVFNDGVYCYNDELNLKDEVFNGIITALAVPNDFLAIAEEIAGWQDKHGEAVTSPYTSESFGGYTYQKAIVEGSAVQSWQSAFATRLRRWRKI